MDRWVSCGDIFHNKAYSKTLPRGNNRENILKTKFINIPKEQRTAIRDMAIDALHAFERHSPDSKRFRGNDKKNFYVYKLSNYQHLRFYLFTEVGNPDKIEFVSKYKEGSVIFDVTRKSWTRKLFFDLMKAKNVTV